VHLKARAEATARDVIPWPYYDLYRTTDLLELYDPQHQERVKSIGLGRALSRAGVFQVAGGNNSAVIDGVRARFWAVRNVEKYKRAGPVEAKTFYEVERKARPHGAAKFDGSHGQQQTPPVQAVEPRRTRKA
jgi:hypothetical protein